MLCQSTPKSIKNHGPIAVNIIGSGIVSGVCESDEVYRFTEGLVATIAICWEYNVPLTRKDTACTTVLSNQSCKQMYVLSKYMQHVDALVANM
jgi:hypothetical protein